MSAPFYRVTCTQCAHESAFSYNTRFEYEGEDAPHTAPELHKAWCVTCDRIRMACAPYSRDDADAELADLMRRQQDQQSTLLHKLGIPLYGSRREYVQDLEAKIAAVNRRARYFDSNTFPARCLTCGNTAVRGIALPTEDDVTVITSVLHRCGGRIQLRIEGRLSFGGYPTVVYGPAGLIVSDERDKDGS